MAGKAYQSCLAPYESEIVALRRKRPPTPYSKIVEYMQEKHQIKVCRETIYSFLKVRAKGFKTCKYAWSIELQDADNQPVAEAAVLQKKAASVTPKPIVSVKPETDRFEFTYIEGKNNLTPLSPEEIEARREKERMNKEPEDIRQMKMNSAFEHPIPLPAGVSEDNVLKHIQNIIAKNGRFDYLTIYDIPIISQYFFDKIKELGCKRDSENRSYCTDPAIVLKIVKAVYTLDEKKGKKLLSKIMEAG